MSLYKPKAVYAASEWQYAASGGEVHVPRGVIYEWWEEEIDTRIVKANAVLRELYRSVVTKWELPNIAKLSIFKLVFVLILTYGNESWVMTEIILSHVQTEVMGFM